MKKIGFLTTLLVGGLLLTGCNNNQETVPEENFVLTGGFSPAPKVENEKIVEPKQPEIPEKFKDIDFSKIDVRTINLQELTPQERQYLNEHLDWDKLSVDERTYLIHGHDPFEYEEKAGTYSVKSKIVHEGCDKYINNEFGFQIDLSDWTNDCKITYNNFSYPDWQSINIILWSLPQNDYGWFEGWGDFETITIIAKDEEIKNKDPLFNYDEVSAENNKYKFYRISGSASPSFYETYIPLNGDENFSVFDI